VEDIQALVQEAGGSAFAFGHSSGGVLALETAAHTLGITKLALYEPPFIIDDSRPPVPVDYVEHLAELASTDRRSDAVEYFMVTGVGVPPEVVAPMKDLPFWPALEAVAHTLSYDGRIKRSSTCCPTRADGRSRVRRTTSTRCCSRRSWRSSWQAERTSRRHRWMHVTIS
jgi:pimeloyl-ACP methyl ester carboxylesterase